MYPRQNQNTVLKNKDVQKELEAENKKIASNAERINSILSTGNENAGKMILDAEESGDDLFGMLEDAVEEKKQVPAEQKADKQEPAGDLSAQNNINNENDDLFDGFIEEAQKEANNPVPGAYGQKNPAKAIFPGDKPGKPEFYKDPADLQEKLEIQGNEEELLSENLLDLSDSSSMKPQGRKKKNNSWRVERTKKELKKGGDLNNADQTQQRIAGLNIAVQKLGKRNKAGRFRQMMTNFAIAAGGTIGAAFNWIGALFKRAFNSEYRALYSRGQSKNTVIPEIEQDKRRHDLIPGWNGETFKKGPNGEDDILADFRRIPTVWSSLTAGQAEDKNGKPLAPKISIYIREGREDEDKTINGTDPGHAGIGIEYSRYSLRSNRYERYNLRYGFFPGSQETKQGSLAMTGNARIPGQLKNEYGNTYTIRRTFPASAKQVNAVLKASETYADKGYNSFTRNCTTFVKDMIKDEAGIPAGDAIFEQETPGFSSLLNFAMFSSKASENTAKAAIEERFARLGTDKDLNYGGEGNMRVNQQDYRQYKESLANSDGGYIDKADLPKAVAGNMRRMEGENAGLIGSKSYFGTARINPDLPHETSSAVSSGLAKTKIPQMEAGNIRGAIVNESNSLIRTILSVTQKRSMRDLTGTPGIDPNVIGILGQIEHYSKPLEQAKPGINDPEKLRRVRSALEKEVNDLNTLLFGFFQNDARLHLPVMHMISLLEYGISIVDHAYENADIGENVGGDLGNIRKRMDNALQVTYTKPDPENPAKNKKVSTRLSPSRYEAYL